MIRWINTKLGTAAFTDLEISDDVVVLDVRDLVDKHGNSPKTTLEKIKQGVWLLQQGCPLVVCCDYGISRSNAIAAGILSLHDGITFELAVRQVIKATGEQEIKLEPLGAVRAALVNGDDITLNTNETRLLITGGSGFIGKQLQQKLGNDFFWIAPSRQDANLAAGALELDLLIKEYQINTVVHLANPRIYTSNQAMGETLTLLRNVLDVCRENSSRLIYPSSWEIYSGYRANNILMNEEVPAYPKGPYGETKVLCENLINMHRSQYGTECIVLRASPVYGENSDRPKFIYNFLTKALKDEEILTHRYINGDPLLDLMSINDFVSAIVASIKSDYIGSLNIGSGVLVSTRQIAEWIVKQCDSKSVVDSKDIHEYSPNVCIDYSCATKTLGWRPEIFWEDGLRQIISKF